MPPRSPDPTTVTPEVLRGWPLPEPTGGKNARGSILVIGGSTETLGAVLLAAEASMRAGAGKLQVATVASMAPHVATALPEALVRALPETDGGAIGPEAADVVRDLAEGADAVLIGPGMADTEATQAFGERLLPHLRGPLALDALGLAVVTADDGCVHHLEGRVVLTPNPTEAAYSLHVEEEEIDGDPAGSAAALAARTKAVVGLGGATSWIAAPDGRLWRDDSGNDGLGVSGSGDVRAGITGGLLARGATPEQAAVWAAWLHGRCGERLASSVGRLGFLARELPGEVPRALAEVAPGAADARA
ncbi:NAD(P)H-hydrate dehydratase [Blastococcus sp. TML/M2B]|uniref:NAD(P)H-hydrate dehydratase n=1 Tax=unclassified Blastococcus TaxID=2619396 RepID=UPI00190CEADA|nr:MULTISPECIES: NAD(P)H-hydrate dehydratase [unclassified Blastococcus]MBN1094285.1 NAD(P)H-hydrate dehydratase [Blastococcus sp. TML/M2B]MBN1095597.1 NAD(P)H-hydrate dehydratase [Blastococcus sp. TML/C7B]